MATNTPKVVTISNEDEAFEYFEAALRGELADQPLALHFENWPVVSIKFEGPGYDSTITPGIAEALVQFQHALNRSYARATHHTTNARSLTAEERRQLQFKAKVEKGSSLITVDLGEFAKHLASAVVDKMDSAQLVQTVLGTALIAGSVIAWRSYLKHQSENIKVNAETREKIALSQQETRRAEVLAEAVTQRPLLAYATQDLNDVRREFLRSGADAVSVTTQGMKLSGAEAWVMSRAPRSESEDVQLNGHYVIQKVDWTHQDVVRLALMNTDTHAQFMASFKRDALTQGHRERLQSAEWERLRAYMAINGTRLRGEITSAVVVSVDWPKDESSQT